MGFLNSSIFDSTSSTSQATNTQNAAFSEVSGPVSSLNLNLSSGGKGSNNGATINMLDNGAISKAFDFASQFGTDALHQVELAGDNTRSSISEAVQAVSESARSETENILIQGAKWAVIAVVAVAGFYALAKIMGK